MNFQDWNEVKWDKSGQKKNNESKKDFALREQLAGRTITQVKKTTGLNKSSIQPIVNMKKLENEEETFKHNSVSLNMSKKIAQKRASLKLTQKDLAFKLSLPEKTIKEYESGKAIPNHNIINKIEKILGRVRD
jgi:putative transcription factor